MNLPIHKRINWKLWFREHRRTFWLLYIALTVGMFVALVNAALEYYELVEEGRLRHSSYVLEQKQLASIGSPGYVRTDWTEGTVDIQVRRIKY